MTDSDERYGLSPSVATLLKTIEEQRREIERLTPFSKEWLANKKKEIDEYEANITKRKDPLLFLPAAQLQKICLDFDKAVEVIRSLIVREMEYTLDPNVIAAREFISQLESDK